jgi:oligopeptidase A
VPLATEVMLAALGELYSVSFTPAGVPGWHPDVEAYDLRDAAGQHLARIYCDWYEREGKTLGGWMTQAWYATDGGPHHLGLVVNMPRSGADLHQLRIVWHEFGHVLHFAFCRSRYRLRSPDYGALDFIEAPSRIMEQWPLSPEILRRMGVDERVAAGVRAEQRFRIASRRLVRLARPAIDLALHRGQDPLAAKQRYLPVPVEPDDATLAQFGHLFGGNYGGGHYTYTWATVLAADLFTRFAAAGVLDPATGRDYAARVLAPGAERDPADLVRDFLGRDPGLAALLAEDGVG